jgi:hypothetical protein
VASTVSLLTSKVAIDLPLRVRIGARLAGRFGVVAALARIDQSVKTTSFKDVRRRLQIRVGLPLQEGQGKEKWDRSSTSGESTTWIYCVRLLSLLLISLGDREKELRRITIAHYIRLHPGGGDVFTIID